MTDWIDYTQCSECGKQCQNGGHCIGGMGGKDTKCPGFIRYVPKIRIEKDVWESTLNHSMELQAENEKMKDVILTIKHQCELLMPKNGLNPVTQRDQLCQTFISLIKRELGDLKDE